MWKLLGACLILGCGYGLFRLYARHLSDRVGCCQALLDLLRYIRLQIDCFCLPRQEIFHSFSNPRLEAVGYLKQVKETGSLCPRGIAAIPPEVTDLLTAFDSELGRGYRQEELGACDYYVKRLEEFTRAQELALPTRLRVGRTVCLSGAALLVLLLI